MGALAILNNITKYLNKKHSIDGIVISGPGNISYATGINIQAAYSIQELSTFIYITKTEKTLVCPKSLAPVYQDAGWRDDVMIYPACADAQKKALSRLISAIMESDEKPKTIAYIGDCLPEKALLILTENLPDIQFTDISADFAKMRRVKLNFELENLFAAARFADHGIAGAIHHVARNQSKSDKFLSEDIRVHALERGLHIGGYQAISQAVGEERAKSFWPDAPYFGIGRDGGFSEGSFARLEMRGMFSNYWADDARILFKGKALDAEKAAFYAKMAELRKFACSIIRPGISAKVVFEEIRQKADEIALNVISEVGFGNGIGVELRESPYICAWDKTILENRMTIILNISALYENEEILISKDTLFVTESGCEIIGWYENWDYPYVTAFTF